MSNAGYHLMEKIAKFFHLPRIERRLFLEAVFWCAVARLAILFIPFHKYLWLLGKPQNSTGEPKPSNPFDNESHTPEIENQETLTTQIGKAVHRASRHVPWKTRCLVEAIAAKRMLLRRKIKCTIYLGVAKENNGEMIAHAWLKSKNIVLTGGKNLKKFTVVSIFE